ncbi:MAG: putative membrane protein YfcA [Candidatus Omnitrophota bacterium]|jgi:uncharacterized protein
MEPLEYILLAAIGVCAGFLNVMAGGGSLITLPVMIFFGIPGAMANGTNRVAIVIQNIVAVAGFHKQGFADFRLSLTLGLCTLPGAIAGALVATRVSGTLFNRILAGVMVGVLILMVSQRKKKPATDEVTADAEPRNLLWGHLGMVGIGFYGGFIQAGVGFMLMALLHRVMGLDLVRVNMHKVFIVLMFTTCALITFALSGQVLWLVGLVLATGNATGGWIGAHVAVKKGDRWIQVILYVALSAMALRLLTK